MFSTKLILAVLYRSFYWLWFNHWNVLLQAVRIYRSVTEVPWDAHCREWKTTIALYTRFISQNYIAQFLISSEMTWYFSLKGFWFCVRSQPYRFWIKFKSYATLSESSMESQVWSSSTSCSHSSSGVAMNCSWLLLRAFSQSIKVIELRNERPCMILFSGRRLFLKKALCSCTSFRGDSCVCWHKAMLIKVVHGLVI